MLYVLFFVVSLLSSIVGGICGVGGGVIIKPVLDATGVLSVSAISFLSGCTVLSMSIVNFLRNRKQKGVLDIRISTALAVGAVAGGLLGKSTFDLLKISVGNENVLGATQAAILLVITLGSLIYSLKSANIRTLHLDNLLLCGVIGLALGALSSFLGIGGGPINLTVLFFFFSMDMKKAAANSLYIIMFSQLSSLAQTLAKGVVPVDVAPLLLVLMVVAGVVGGLVGSKLNKKLSAKTANRLFIGFMVLIVCINVFNIIKFSI